MFCDAAKVLDMFAQPTSSLYMQGVAGGSTGAKAKGTEQDTFSIKKRNKDKKKEKKVEEKLKKGRRSSSSDSNSADSPAQ